MTKKEFETQKALGLLPKSTFLYKCNICEEEKPMIKTYGIDPDSYSRNSPYGTIVEYRLCLKCNNYFRKR